MNQTTTYEKVELMQKRCMSIATGGSDFSYEDFESARDDLLSDAAIFKQLPEWLIRCRYGSQFWSFIKKKDATYQGRREFLWDEFGPILDHIERKGVEPTSLSVQDLLAICDSDSVSQAWKKCFERRDADPEGAITSARTLVESTCKYILENLGETPDNSGKLPRLYKQTAKAMNLGPQQHEEQVFRQILTGCGTVVEGLSSLRNKFSDAHGKGPTVGKPSKRHAELAVNLAGTLSSFLVATYEENYRGIQKEEATND